MVPSSIESYDLATLEKTRPGSNEWFDFSSFLVKVHFATKSCDLQLTDNTPSSRITLEPAYSLSCSNVLIIIFSIFHSQNQPSPSIPRPIVENSKVIPLPPWVLCCPLDFLNESKEVLKRCSGHTHDDDR